MGKAKWAQVVLLLIQLPADISGKAAEGGQSAWTPTPHGTWKLRDSDFGPVKKENKF